MGKKALKDLERDLAPHLEHVGSLLLHRSSGSYYIFSSAGFNEEDLSIRFEYHPEHFPTVKFYRPIKELTDGRFLLVRKGKPPL